MGIHGYTWVYMGIHGYTWVYMGIHGYTWIYMGIHGYTRVYMGIQGVQGYTWVYNGIQGYTWVYKGIQGYTRVYIGIKAHFSSPQQSGEMDTSQTPDRSEDTTFESLKPKTSHWTPLPGKFSSLDYYITKCRSEVNKLNFKQRSVKDNLTPEE